MSTPSIVEQDRTTVCRKRFCYRSATEIFRCACTLSRAWCGFAIEPFESLTKMTTFKSSRTITLYFEARDALFRAARHADHLEEQVLLRR
jgi:hypothetical protein